MRISIYFCWQWSGKVAIGWPYSPDGIQHLTPNKCLKYLGRKSVGLKRLNPTLRISIHHCWLWSGKVAIGWPYSPDGIQHLTPKLRVTLRVFVLRNFLSEVAVSPNQSDRLIRPSLWASAAAYIQDRVRGVRPTDSARSLSVSRRIYTRLSPGCPTDWLVPVSDRQPPPFNREKTISVN